MAEAWLRHPAGYVRELRAVVPALEDDETPLKVFPVFLGRRLGPAGLLFMTDRGLIWVKRRSFRRKIVRIAYREIRDVRLVETRRNSDLKIVTDDQVYNLWRGGLDRDRKHLRSVYTHLEEMRASQQL